MDIYDEILGRTTRLEAPSFLGPDPHTFGELMQAAERVAAALKRAGAHPGDRVELCFDVGFAFTVSLLAVVAAETTGILLAPSSTAAECERLRMLSTPRFTLLPATRTMPHEPFRVPTAIGQTGIGLITHIVESEPCEPGDAMLIYTSGTSATPKGVILTRQNFDTNIRGVNIYLQLSPEDRSPVFTPTAYAYAVSQALTHALAGAAVYPIPEGMSHPHTVLRVIAQARLTGLAANPTVFKAMLEAQAVSPHDLSSLRFVMSAGQFLEWELVERLEAACPTAQVINTYGCTENSPRIAYLPLKRGAPRGDTSYVPVGYPVEGTTIRIIDEAGETVPAGEIGEVAVGGGARMRGYWKHPEATRARVVNGEFRTGDWGRRDEQGRLHLVGRDSNIIHVGHHKVSPEEIEAVLLEHPAIKDAGVFGAPDALREEVVVAKIVIDEGGSLTVDEVIRYCLDRLSRFKVPRRISFVASLPQTRYGKLDRSRLRSEVMQPA